MERRPKSAEPTDKRQTLTPEQQTVVDELAGGAKVTEIAEKLNLTPDMIREWCDQSAVFKAALNKRRHEEWSSIRDRLRSLSRGAIDLIEAEIKQGNVKAAMVLLRSVGLDRLPPPDGPVDPADIEAAAAEADFTREGRSLVAKLMKGQTP